MTSNLQLWAGIECTVNRVAETFFDQLEWSGHARRAEDLDLFASLGVKAIRYPLLWERVAPNGLAQADWTWADQRMERLRQLGIRPIVGLVHHGSGPRHTSLVDPAFPQQLAEYARAVAQRYPWVDAYTPVNEPLTTARFSGLYGHWYPHGRDENTFARALLNQVRGTQLAMQAIRQVNPAAQLVQTEDLGKVYSTPTLDYQADYENTRRWLSLDLLVGRMTKKHSLYDYFDWAGISENELRAVVEAPCPPDVIGLNYYITGERFLDERLERYPAQFHGGNGQHQYADIEAVRVVAEGVAGIGVLMQEVWERYRRPLVVSEVHLGATRDEQVRWLVEVWQEAQAARAAGVDIRAITIWSLLGAYNWHCLVTRDECHYEPGVFDLRSGLPRPTLLAQAARALVERGSFDHPVLDTPGWWRQPTRLLYPAVPRRAEFAYFRQPAAGNVQDILARTESALAAETDLAQDSGSPSGSPIAIPGALSQPAPRQLLITGATGTLGQAFQRLCEMRGLPYHLATRQEMDLTDPQAIEAVLEARHPWAVINAAGYVRVDQAEQEPEACFQANTYGALNLAHACQRREIPFLTFSSDLVFDGQQQTPYLETSPVNPLNVYGRSKAEAEAQVLQAYPAALVVRTSAFFGPWDSYNFATQTLQAVQQQQPALAAQDVLVSPTYVPDLVNASLDLLLDGEQGLWHLANQGGLSWYEFACQLAETARLDTRHIQPCELAEMPFIAPRPRYSVLASERGILLPPLENAVERYYGAVKAVL